MLHHFSLFILSQHEGYAGYGAHLVWLELGVATDNNDTCARVIANELMDGLAALMVGHLRDAACIHDTDVRHLTGLGFAHTLRLQLLCDCRCLGKVQLAT